MNNIVLSKDLDKLPFVLVRDGAIIEVSQQFINITQFTSDELLNYDVENIFKTLRIGPNVSIDSIDEKKGYFLFTKSLEVKLVNIKVVDKGQEKAFIFLEKPNFSFDSTFPFLSKLCLDNYYGVAIFSMPDITLLKANKTFISFFDNPFNRKENCIGKRASEFVTGFEGSTLEKVWQNIIETGETYNTDEYMFNHFERGVTYWKSTITPLYEDGELKYCIEMTTDITERVLQRKKIVEQAEIIKQQKDELQEIIHSIDDAIYIYDDNKNFYLVNNAGKGTFYDAEYRNFDELNNNTPYKYYDENGNEITTEDLVVSRVSRGEVIVNYKMTVKCSRKTKHYSVNGRPVYDCHGKVKFAVISCRDITKDVEAQRQVEQQKQQLEAIIENISDPIMVFDKDGNYVLKNKAAQERFTDSLRSIGDSYRPGLYFDLEGNEVPLDSIPSVRVLNGDKFKEQILHVKHPTGEKYLSVSGTPVYNSNGDLRLGVLCTRDITIVTKQNEEIRRQKELLEKIIENSYENIYVVDADGNYLVNKNNIDEEMSAKFSNLEEIYELAKFYDMDGNVLSLEKDFSPRVRNGETVKDKIIQVKVLDQEYYFLYSGKPILDKNEKFLYGIGCSRNVTEMMKNQMALNEAHEKLLASKLERNKALEQALEMKDEFLSLISHEFRTPLNVINTAIQAINYFCINELPEKAKKYLDMIRLNTFRQLRLVNNLLDITKANAGQIKINKRNLDIVFLSRVITESVQTYASQKGISLDFMCRFEERVIGIDEEKYERILLNLLSNAIKYTPKGKAITVNLTAKKNYVCIEVKDEGIGIPKDKLDIIFERFGQVDSSLSRQAEGTGIGLSLVKKFVEALGGSISVKSTPGKGSTFIILLPDEAVDEENDENEMIDLMSNRLVHVTNIEFSDIYL
jgi:PAS domain S-box-containing protein